MGFWSRLFGKSESLNSREDIEKMLIREAKRAEARASPGAKQLNANNAVLQMACPSCGNNTAYGRVDRYGIAEFECKSCGWSGSIEVH